MVFKDFFQQIFFLMREIEWKKFLRIKEIFFSNVKKVFFFFQQNSFIYVWNPVKQVFNLTAGKRSKPCFSVANARSHS